MSEKNPHLGTTLDEWLAEECEKDPTFGDGLRNAEMAVRFGLDVARLREGRGMTQKELGTLTGIRQPHLSRIERGHIPTVPVLTLLAKALGGRVVIEDGGPRMAARKAHPERVRMDLRRRVLIAA